MDCAVALRDSYSNFAGLISDPRLHVASAGAPVASKLVPKTGGIFYDTSNDTFDHSNTVAGGGVAGVAL
jgi:hypothetical protein